MTKIKTMDDLTKEQIADLVKKAQNFIAKDSNRNEVKNLRRSNNEIKSPRGDSLLDPEKWNTPQWNWFFETFGG